MLKWYIVQLLCPLANMLTDIEEKMGFGCNWQCNSLKPWHYSTSCLHPRVIYYLLKSKKTESTIAMTDNQRRAEHENIQFPPDFLTVWSKQASTTMLVWITDFTNSQKTLRSGLPKVKVKSVKMSLTYVRSQLSYCFVMLRHLSLTF